jgi:hypothetical protein
MQCKFSLRSSGNFTKAPVFLFIFTVTENSGPTPIIVWLTADADLFREKNTAGWLLVAGLLSEKNTVGLWLISQTNTTNIFLMPNKRVFAWWYYLGCLPSRMPFVFLVYLVKARA